MTKEEFMIGWDTLTAQPWGRRYTDRSTEEARKIATTQLEFYYRTLHKFEGAAWQRGCDIFAQGERWPSVDEMRRAINMTVSTEKRIEYKTEPAPEPIVRALTYAEHHHCSFTEGVQQVFPAWLDENHGHPDYEEALKLWKQLRNVKAPKISTAAALKSLMP